MSTPLIRRPESNGASTQAIPEMNRATAPGLAEYALPATSRDLGAQAAAVLGLLTGVWVALSPWFLTLQNTGTNANTENALLKRERDEALDQQAAITANHFPGIYRGKSCSHLGVGGPERASPGTE